MNTQSTYLLGMCICTPTTHTVIAKVFRQADTEETGVVESSQVPALATKVLGSGAKESDIQLVRYLAETKAGEKESGRHGFCFLDSMYHTPCTTAWVLGRDKEAVWRRACS